MPIDSDSEHPPILLVEDNPDDEGLALRAFKKSGVRNPVVIARDGEEAVGYLSGFKNGSTPCLILLDLKLPKLGGIDVLERIRANESTRLTPVVVLTSSDELIDIHACYVGGANAFVRKPVDFDDFIETIDTIVKFWLRKNLLPGKTR